VRPAPTGGEPGPTVAATPATDIEPPVPANAQPVEEMTPEQQVEAIRRRIEARRAMRAQEGADERAAQERDKQVE